MKYFKACGGDVHWKIHDDRDILALQIISNALKDENLVALI